MRDRRAAERIYWNARFAVCGHCTATNGDTTDIFDLLDAAGYTDAACEECGAKEGEEHEDGCRRDPNWEPSDDDLDLSGEGAAASAEAERRALRDAGRLR